MGINAQIEEEDAEVIQVLPDPSGRLKWILRVAPLNGTTCLKFIDPYGDAVFNQLQMPVLKEELQSISRFLTEENLASCKSNYLTRATTWPPGAIQEARDFLDSFGGKELRDHLSILIELIAKAHDCGPHHYVRFIGD